MGRQRGNGHRTGSMGQRYNIDGVKTPRALFRWNLGRRRISSIPVLPDKIDQPGIVLVAHIIVVLKRISLIDALERKGKKNIK